MAGNSATLQIAIEVTDNGSVKIRNLGKAAQEAGREGSRGFDQLKTSVDSTETSINRASASTMSLSSAVGTFAGVMSAAAIAGFARQVMDTTVAMDSLNRSMTAIYGSQQQAAAEMEFLRQTADRTGQNVYALADSYKQLSASTRGTAIEGESTRRIFSAVSEASAVLGLSNEKTKLSFLALSQMASKGVVSMEELRQQLGENLPGVLNLAAKATGVTVEEFNKMVARGEVLASDLLPKLADELHNMYGAAAETAGMESGVASLNKLEEAWTDMKATIGDSGLIVSTIQTITAAIKGMTSVMAAAKSQSEGMFSGEAFVAGASALEGQELALKRISLVKSEIAEKETEIARIQQNAGAAGLSEQQVAGIQRLNEQITDEKINLDRVTTGWSDNARELQTVKNAQEQATKAASNNGKVTDEQHQKMVAYIQTEKDRAKQAYDLAVKGARSQEELNKVTDVYQATLKKISDKEMKSVTKETANSAREMEKLAEAAVKVEEERERVGRTMLRQAYERAKATQELEDNLLDGKRQSAKEQVAIIRDNLHEEERARTESYAKMKQLSDELYSSMESNLTYWVEGVLKGEFESIQDAFGSLCDAILDAFVQLIAKMIAEWAMSGIVSMFSGNGFNGFSMPSFSGSGAGGFGGSSDYASMGTAAIGAGSAAYGWLSGSDTPAQYTIENAYVDTNGNVDYSGQDASNYGSTAFTAGKEGYNAYTTGSAASSAVPTGMQTAGAAVGAVGGAYGLYSAYDQMQNGTANAGTAVQAAASIYSLYKSYPVLMKAYDAYIVSSEIALQTTEGANLIASSSMFDLGVQGGGAAATTSGGTGAGAGAGGMGAGAAAGAFVAAAVALKMIQGGMNEHATETMVGPTTGISVPMRDYGWDQKYDVTREGQRQMAGLYMSADAYSSTGGQNIYGESGSMGSDSSVMKAQFDQFKEIATGVIDILANDFGDGLAGMALQLDGSAASADAFIDAAAGYDVALSTSSQLADLAAQAATGSSSAMDQLHSSLLGLGMSEETAQTAMMGLIASTDGIAQSSSSAIGAVQGMTSAINDFSNTPLRIAVNVSPSFGGYGVSEYGTSASDGIVNSRFSHATGGIFTSPTLIPSIGGNMHQVAESGYPEAIIPLRSTTQISEIQDGLAALRSEVRSLAAGQSGQPIVVKIIADNKGFANYLAAEVDTQITDQTRRGVTGQRVVYAAH